MRKCYGVLDMRNRHRKIAPSTRFKQQTRITFLQITNTHIPLILQCPFYFNDSKEAVMRYPENGYQEITYQRAEYLDKNSIQTLAHEVVYL